MRVDDFDFELPQERIALRPVTPRDRARMLVVRGGTLEDRKVRDLRQFLRSGDALVLNDTKVFPAELTGLRPPRDPAQAGGAKLSVSLHKQLSDNTWAAFVRPAKRLRQGDEIDFGPELRAEATSDPVEGEVTLRFSKAGAELFTAFHAVGAPPLPPYISSKRETDARDVKDYQTIFADKEGSVAAPTAGLHFTEDLLKALTEQGIRIIRVTLHVGAGTFLPVKVDNTDDHKMHAEWGTVSQQAANSLNDIKKAGGRILCVGTTSLRLLESAAQADGEIMGFAGETDIFITPGYRIRTADMLLTNFHLPKSTLFMLVSAFSGLDTMKAAYAHAIKNGYRFYSYGDTSLLYRAGNGGSER